MEGVFGFTLEKCQRLCGNFIESSMLERYRVERKHIERMADGSYHICGKVLDRFNFVSHASVSITPRGEEVFEFRCDCEHSRQTQTICEHCSALLFSVVKDKMEGHIEPTDSVELDQASAGLWLPLEIELDPPDLLAKDREKKPTREFAEIAPKPDIGSMEVLFGSNQVDNSPIYWHPNDTEQVFHTNTGIIGTMGTGKTQFTKSVVTQLIHQQEKNYDGSPLGILIFDYKGDYNETKADFVEAAEARVLKPYRLPYNPLALNRPQAFKPLLPMHTANSFKDTIAKIYNLGAKQQQVLLDCIEQAYLNLGVKPDDPDTWDRPAPTFEQVYQIFTQSATDRPPDSLSAAMNKLHQFHLFEEDPARARPLARLLQGVVVVDLSGYDGDIQSLIVEITLEQFYAQMQARGSSPTDGRYRQLRSLILVDEADGFMSQDFPSLRKIMKEGREFGVGVILSTQSLTHFVAGSDDYSRYVLTWVVHNVSDLKQKDVEYVFKLQPKSPEVAALYAQIKSLVKHESVAKLSNGAPVQLRDRAFWQLYNDWKKD